MTPVEQLQANATEIASRLRRTLDEIPYEDVDDRDKVLADIAQWEEIAGCQIVVRDAP